MPTHISPFIPHQKPYYLSAISYGKKVLQYWSQVNEAVIVTVSNLKQSARFFLSPVRMFRVQICQYFTFVGLAILGKRNVCVKFSAARFGEILTLWRKLKNLWHILRFFYFKLILGILFVLGQLLIVKWPNIETKIKIFKCKFCSSIRFTGTQKLDQWSRNWSWVRIVILGSPGRKDRMYIQKGNSTSFKTLEYGVNVNAHCIPNDWYPEANVLTNLIGVQSLPEHSLSFCNFRRIKLDERIFQEFGLHDQSVAVGVEPQEKVLGLLCENAVARLWMRERLKYNIRVSFNVEKSLRL